MPGLFVLLAGLNPALLNTMNSYAWGAPWRTPDEAIRTFINSPEYLPGAVYRVFGYSDGRVSMLRLIQHGARLDGEFFPSQARRSWPSIPAYEQSLINPDRHVDVVILWHTYNTRWRSNEHALLRTLAEGAGCADPRNGSQPGRRATVLMTNPSFDAYKISRC